MPPSAAATRTRGPDDVRLLLRAAMHYYVDDLTQAEVASRLGVSRATAGRLIARARANGIVRIDVGLPDGDDGVFGDLETRLERAYGLQEAVVVPDASGNDTTTLNRLGGAAAHLLGRRIKRTDRLGLAWGATMAAMADAMPAGIGSCAEVVQLDGFTGSIDYHTRGEYIINHCADLLGATPFPLSAPLFADPATVESLRKDSGTSQTISRWAQCEAAMFSVGDLSEESTLLRGTYVDADVHNALLAAGAVGDACGRYFCLDGSDADTALAERTLSVGLDQLRACPLSIVVAGGERKHEAILGALRGSLADVLVTDDAAATWLLDQAEQPTKAGAS